MRRPRRRVQFYLRDLLVCIAVVAVLIQPSCLLFDSIAKNLLSPPPDVTVPDGGMMLMVTPDIIIQEEEETLILQYTSGSAAN